MNVALLCEKWQLPFNIELKQENDRGLHGRSYLHYVAEHMPMVSAKCWATEWLLTDIIDTTKEYSVREYMAGVGVQTMLIQKAFKVSKHITGELDENCVRHLESILWDTPIEIKKQDARQALLEEDNSDLKFIDFPNSSIVQIKNKWEKEFSKLFESQPTLVVWTDTSVTYPISLHGKKYGDILGYELNDKYDYVKSYSKWLNKNYGYSIIKAAFRARNAVYFAAVKGKVDTEIKHFDLSEDGFYFISHGIF